jgi:hypothetical protein
MSLTVVNIATWGGTSGVGTTPAGAASGDVLIFMMGSFDQNAVTITPPASTNLIIRVNHASGGDDDICVLAYYLVLTTTPAASYTFTVTGGIGNPVQVSTLAIRGATSTPLDTGPGLRTATDGFGTSIVCPALTTTFANEMLIFFWFGDDAMLVAGPSGGWTTQQDGTTSLPFGIYTKTQATAASTGTINVSQTGNDDYVAMLMAIVPFGASSTAVLPTDAVFFGMT